MRRFLFIISMLACATCAQPEDPASAAPDVGGAVSLSAPEEASPADERPPVVFLGTSLTAGLGLLSDDDSYVARLAELADSAGLPFRAVNAGVSGETSAGGLRRLDWVLRQPLAVLVLELGANDGLRGHDPDMLEDNLRTIIDRTRARHPGSRVVIAGMQAPTNLGKAYTDRFRAIFPTVAEATGSALIPFLLEGVAGVPELNQDDRIHPTAEGHELVARNVWAVLEGVLQELESR
jgi:acyl-CoA thioesterase-1